MNMPPAASKARRNFLLWSLNGMSQFEHALSAEEFRNFRLYHNHYAIKDHPWSSALPADKARHA
jgi:hypothetical protein